MSYHVQVFALHLAASSVMSPVHEFPTPFAEASNVHPLTLGQHRGPAAEAECPISMLQGSRLPLVGFLTIWAQDSL